MLVLPIFSTATFRDDAVIAGTPGPDVFACRKFSAAGRRMLAAMLATCIISVRPPVAAAHDLIRPFASVQQLFTQSCAFSSCHSAAARQGGLVLEHEDLSYASLVAQAAQHPDAQALGLRRVVPGHPEESFLVRKLRGLGPGASMPLGTPRLSDGILETIEEWILRGALTTAAECPPLPAGAEPVCDKQPVSGDFVWQPEEPLDPPEPGTGIQLYVPPKPVDPGAEWEYCYAFRPSLSGLSSQILSRQQYRMHKGSHHLQLYMYFGSLPDQFAEGYYPCSSGQCTRPGDCPPDSGSAMLTIGGTQVAGTTSEVNYPAGVGLRIINPRNAVFIANLHYTNPFQPAQSIYGEAWLNLYVRRPGEAKVQLEGILASNRGDLIVEPYQTKTISRVWQPRSLISGAKSDAAVFQLFGHMHKRGRKFDISFVDRSCLGDCDSDDAVTVDELLTGINIALGSSAIDRCPSFDRDGDAAASVDELVGAVDVALNGCSRPADELIYRATHWDHAPLQEYEFPYLQVDHDQGLRWTCTHENGRLLENGEEDPTYPAKRCHAGCEACGWDEASRTCVFARDHSGRVFREGEPMPLVFGNLADDDMCNMFGYFIHKKDLVRIGQ